MIDREPLAPADALRQALHRTCNDAPLPGRVDSDALLGSVPRGACSPMSVTIAARSTQRQPSTDSPAADSVCARVPTANLPAFAPLSFTSSEACTPAELHAATRAAACPDLFVVHAQEQAAGERVIAEVALFTSGRVLVLSPDPAAADRLTERLPASAVVRALADAENPVRPSPVVARLTSAALGSGRVELLKRETADAMAAAESRLVT